MTYHTVALNLSWMKLLEHLVPQYIFSFPASLDLNQFSLKTNRSAEDAISTALHSVNTP